MITAPPLAEIATSLAAVAPEREPEPLLDGWEMAANEDGAACRDALKAAGYKFQALPARTTRDKDGCGIPNAVVLYRGPTGIAYEPAVMLDCSLARTLGQVEQIVQEEAETHLHSTIARIGNAGAYACRPRNFRKGVSLSAHAFGAALDVSSFHPMKGRSAVIDRDYSGANGARKCLLLAVYSRLRARETDLTLCRGSGLQRASSQPLTPRSRRMGILGSALRRCSPEATSRRARPDGRGERAARAFARDLSTRFSLLRIGATELRLSRVTRYRRRD